MCTAAVEERAEKQTEMGSGVRHPPRMHWGGPATMGFFAVVCTGVLET